MKHGCPQRQQSQNLEVLHFDPAPPQGMSLKCEQSIDELTVQVWLLYDHPNFKYRNVRRDVTAWSGWQRSHLSPAPDPAKALFLQGSVPYLS